MEDEKGKNNFQTVLGVIKIPKDMQFRAILDKMDREIFRPIFKTFMGRLQRGKHLEQYRLWDKSYFIPMDGTEYFSSNTIHCSKCLVKEHKNGTNFHQALQAAIVKPGLKPVLP